ncbi:hypothetical protein OGAPHI_006360 [Ogataea philodendri]|uniref:Uncharacterized protein n=1 Tax=Ogataea philodendri TaxID=1378263 RepID=A0A9P8NX53_9ASCO|nr:uncharacterized protein OGAPHI_006360 [Ogataea philodendri]KAH3661513.1 hypothetical protein OGAPHI_006360 [Ogataea philodendri]
MVSDTGAVVSRLAVTVLIHVLLNAAFPSSRVVSFVTALLVAAVISQSPMFLRWRQRLASMAADPGTSSQLSSRLQLTSALNEMRQYLARAKASNDKKRQLFKTMSWRQQKIVAETGYSAKIKTADALVAENYKVLQKTIAQAVDKYDVSRFELNSAVANARHHPNSSHHRVVEALCHFARDWSPAYDKEVQPILQYITSQLKTLDLKQTTVVVPGSGLGRVAHELALLGPQHVVAVEYSWYMLLLNEFVYSDNKDSYKIYPYTPANLPASPHHMAIVTCFFIDTAENLMDYFDAIGRLADAATGDVLWINVGPLKYGTAAKAELNYEEIKKLRDLCGWQLVNERPEPEILGYLTDTLGLWQGYYGVTMWTCKRRREE